MYFSKCHLLLCGSAACGIIQRIIVPWFPVVFHACHQSYGAPRSPVELSDRKTSRWFSFVFFVYLPLPCASVVACRIGRPPNSATEVVFHTFRPSYVAARSSRPRSYQSTADYTVPSPCPHGVLSPSTLAKYCYLQCSPHYPSEVFFTEFTKI